MPVKAGDHLGTGVLVGPDDLAQVFRVELTGQGGRVHQVTEEDGELASFGVWGGRGAWWSGRWREPLLRVRLACRHVCRQRQEGHVGCTRPHEDATVLLHRDAAHLNEFRFQIVEVVIVERELALEGTIGEALILLEPLDDLCEDLFEGHSRPSARRAPLRCASSRAYLTRPSAGTP
jgi:hypothetical protein